MTPDEYRRKNKSCYTCGYFQKSNPFKLQTEMCLVKNRAPEKGVEDKKCKVYKPIPYLLEQIQKDK